MTLTYSQLLDQISTDTVRDPARLVQFLRDFVLTQQTSALDGAANSLWGIPNLLCWVDPYHVDLNTALGTSTVEKVRNRTGVTTYDLLQPTKAKQVPVKTDANGVLYLDGSNGFHDGTYTTGKGELQFASSVLDICKNVPGFTVIMVHEFSRSNFKLMFRTPKNGSATSPRIELGHNSGPTKMYGIIRRLDADLYTSFQSGDLGDLTNKPAVEVYRMNYATDTFTMRRNKVTVYNQTLGLGTGNSSNTDAGGATTLYADRMDKFYSALIFKEAISDSVMELIEDMLIISKRIAI